MMKFKLLISGFLFLCSTVVGGSDYSVPKGVVSRFNGGELFCQNISGNWLVTDMGWTNGQVYNSNIACVKDDQTLTSDEQKAIQAYNALPMNSTNIPQPEDINRQQILPNLKDMNLREGLPNLKDMNLREGLLLKDMNLREGLLLKDMNLREVLKKRALR